MKRFILLLLAFYSINCTLNECINEGDTSKCYSHEVDVDNFTCHLVHYDSSSIKNRFDEDELFYLLADKCIPYPDLAQDQKTFWDLNYTDMYKTYLDSAWNFIEQTFVKNEKFMHMVNFEV